MTKINQKRKLLKSYKNNFSHIPIGRKILINTLFLHARHVSMSTFHKDNIVGHIAFVLSLRIKLTH